MSQIFVSVGKGQDCSEIGSHEDFIVSAKDHLGISRNIDVKVIFINEHGFTVPVKNILQMGKKIYQFGLEWEMPVFIDKETKPTGFSVLVNTLTGVDEKVLQAIEDTKVEFLRDAFKKKPTMQPSPDTLVPLYCNSLNTRATADVSYALMNKFVCLRFEYVKGYSSFTFSELLNHFQDFSGFDVDLNAKKIGPGTVDDDVNTFMKKYEIEKAKIMQSVPLFDVHCHWVHQYLLCCVSLAPTPTNEAFRRLLINPIMVAVGACITSDESFIASFCEASNCNSKPSHAPSVYAPASTVCELSVEYIDNTVGIGRGPLDYRFGSLVTDCVDDQPSLKKARFELDDNDESKNGEDIDQSNVDQRPIDGITDSSVIQSVAGIQSLIVEAKSRFPVKKVGDTSHLTLVGPVGQLGAQMYDELMRQKARLPTSDKVDVQVKGILSTGQHYLLFIARFFNKKSSLHYVGRINIPMLPSVGTDRTSVKSESGIVSLVDVRELVAFLICFTQYLM